VRLLKLIGEELISDEATAIVELVKNAYDADASTVKITFEGTVTASIGLSPFSYGITRIIIDDDGEGMSLETVLGPWLEPGTRNKDRKSHSDRGRILQGAKGIGRFAVSKLAEQLTLETTDRATGRRTDVIIDWGKLSDDDYLSDVEVLFDEQAPKSNAESEADQSPPGPWKLGGTTLTLERIKKRWTRRDFDDLEIRLERLLSPFHTVENFDIHLVYPESTFDNPLSSAMDNLIAPYEVKGLVTADGVFTGLVRCEDQNGILQEFPIDGLKLLTQPADGDQQALELEYPTCGPFEIQLRAFNRDRQELEKVVTKGVSGTSNYKEVRDLLDQRCGMAVYRDSVRVYPYGQPGDDWLQLDKRRFMKPTMNLANNQILGAILIGRETNPHLQDRSSREGLISTQEFDDLRRKAVAILAMLETRRYELRKKGGAVKVTPRAQPVFSALTLKPTIERLKTEAKASEAVIKIVEEADAGLKEGVERVQDLYSTLLATAGLGHLVDLVIHEIGNPLGKAVLKTEAIRKTIEKDVPEPPKAKMQGQVDDLKLWHSQIHALRQRLEPNTAAKRGKATTFDVGDEIKATVELFSAVIAKADIDVDLKLPADPLIVKMNRSALSQVLANLCDNATYWMTRPDSPPQKKLEISARPIPAGFEVTVSDSGPGVPEDVEELIFDPYFSTKPDGMGLGLHIARLVTEAYGTVHLEDVGALGGATFIATFEKSVGRGQ
jgi:hypothetical protein